LRVGGDIRVSEEAIDSIVIKCCERKMVVARWAKSEEGKFRYYDLAVCTAIYVTISEYGKYRYFT
jgi:hypothetical protein